MALQNFVDNVGPPIHAAWLNQLDVLANTVFGGAQTNPAARTALFLDAPLEITNGGTAARDPVTALSNLGGFPTSSFTQSNIGLAFWPTVAGEVGVVNNYYPYYDIRRYGGDPTGAAASDTALANVITFCGTNGGTIRFPNGKYTFANQLNLNLKRFLIFQGDGGSGGGAQSGTQLVYTGTASPWITTAGANNIIWRDMYLTHTNAGFPTTGQYIQGGNTSGADCSFCGVYNCTMGAALPATHLNLDKCIQFTADNVNFLNGNPSVIGQATGGASYANVCLFKICQWTGSSIVAPAGGMIQNGGTNWIFLGCTLEGIGTSLATAAASGFYSPSGTQWLGLVVKGCWLGDVGASAAASTWFNIYGQTIDISNNYISGNGAAGTTTGSTFGQVNGMTIQNNIFIGLLNGINFAAGTSGQITVLNNVYVSSGIGNAWLGTAAHVGLGQMTIGANFGFGVPPGHGVIATNNSFRVNGDNTIEMMGNASVTAGTPVTISFSTVLGQAVPNSTLVGYGCTLVTPGVATNTAYITAPSATSITLNVNGTGANTVQWRAVVY